MTTHEDDRHRWTPLSRHLTSEGWVRYLQCACGRVRVELDGAPQAVVGPEPSSAVVDPPGARVVEDGPAMSPFDDVAAHVKRVTC